MIEKLLSYNSLLDTCDLTVKLPLKNWHLLDRVSAFGAFGIGGERWRRRTWAGYLQSRRQLGRVDFGVELTALFTLLPGRDAKVEVEQSRVLPPVGSVC